MKLACKELTIIIILYEEKDDLVIQCLNNIINFRIIIIDNANNESLKKKLQEKFNIEKYLLNKKNIGFTKAANQAIKLCKTEYILNLNADCFIKENDIIKLLDSHKNYKNCFMVSPTFYDNNSNLVYNAGTFYEKQMPTEVLNLEGDVCVDKVLGSALLFKKRDIENLNFLDENFFIYFEDDDLCKKAKNKNMSVIQIFNAKAIHIHGRSKVKNILKKIYLRNYHFTHDQLYYYYKLGDNQKYFQLKKNLKNYIFKMIIHFIILDYKKSLYYFSLINAYINFTKLKSKLSKSD